MPFFLTETFVYSVFGMIVIGVVYTFYRFPIFGRHDEKNKNNPKLHRINMWIAPLALWLVGVVQILKYGNLTSRIVIGLLLILLSFLSYRIHRRKWKQALQAENKNEEQGEVDE